MKRNEEIEQAKVVKWSHKVAVREVMPQLRWLHHSPNGGKRSAVVGAQMKALGTKAGFLDLILPVRSGNYPGLVIEMKSDVGTLTREQKEWRDHFEAQGWAFRLSRSAQDARTQLCLYLGIPPDNAPALEEMA